MADTRVHPVDQLRQERDEAAAKGDHGTALVLNDRIRSFSDMSAEEIDAMVQGSDLYSPTVKKVAAEFSAELQRRSARRLQR